MGTINDVVGTIGGVILILELMLLLVLLIAINAALLFGLRWIHGRTGWAQEKRRLGQTLLTRYVDRGTNVVAAPVIGSASLWQGLKAGLHRATHWPHEGLGTATALPVRSPEGMDDAQPPADSPRVA